MARIRDDFPEIDINQSTLNDALKQCATNERSIKEMLVSEEREARIKELQSQFTAIPRDVIIQILQSVKWDVEEAILPLFNTLDKYQKVEEDEMKRLNDLRQSQMPRPKDEKIKIETVIPTAVVESPFKEDVPQPTLENKQTVSLSASPSNVDIRNPITVTWELTSGESNSYDWIGMFQIENSNKNYLTYQWRGPNEKGCSLTFPAPTNYGTYEFRYIPYGSYTHIAISNQITVGPQIEIKAKQDSKILIVNWNAKVSNEYTSAWIGLYEKSQTNNKMFLTWEYAKSKEIILQAPVKPGDYEIRYFSYSYTHVATSNVVTIEGHDSIEAILKEGNVVAKVSIVTMDPYYDSVWIGMYVKGEENNRNIKRYKYITERECEVQFSVPERNVEYEFRLFANKNYDLKLKSNSFVFDK